MNDLKISTTDGRTAFAPGETLEAAAEWLLDNPADAIELRLLWSTVSDDDEGTTSACDTGIVERVRWEAPRRSDQKRWTVTLPNGPYSFLGDLFSLVWALELIAEPTPEVLRLEITVAPHGKAIQLHPQSTRA